MFVSEPDYVANPIGSDFDADERALSKAKKDGTEGLSESEIRDLKECLTLEFGMSCPRFTTD